MRLLVLGGTRFVGRAIVEEAVKRQHVVTVFNRGRTGTDVTGVEVVRGDREVEPDLERLTAGRSWDTVVDASGYVPCVVGDSARALDNCCDLYVFLSTVSVYPAWPKEGVHEDSPVYECSSGMDGTAEDEANWSAVQYGTYKAGCERAVREVFNDRALVLRPGVIVGPRENVGRLPWWLRRIERGGRVLAPGRPDRAIQPIDARDLARFTLDCIEIGVAGAFNVAAPRGHATFGLLLQCCAEVTAAAPELVWVNEQFLLDCGVRQWTEIPLWRTAAGTWEMATERAQAVGLTCRPLSETVADTWKWLREEGDSRARYARQAHHGLAPDKERELLAAWEAWTG